MRLPQESQNFRPFGFAVPHLAQTSASARGAAHSPQNFAPSRFSQPQLEHFTRTDSSRQLLQQYLRVLQVARVEAFGEPGVERGEEGAGRVALALALPEPRQAGGGAQLEGLCLLPPG